MAAELLRVTRGSLVETVRRGHLAVVDARGRLLAASGDPDTVTYMRSSAKPVQATAVLWSGAAERFGIAGPLLAVCCASHRGEPGHVEAVGSVLERADIPPSALQCGIHPPMSVAAAAEVWRSGGAPMVLHNNCSGKHTGMLASARALDAPLDSYLDPDHPVQRHITSAVAALAGLPADAIVLGIDGCSAPVHGMPVQAMARIYARLADPSSAPDYAPFLAPIAAAMTAHPWYVQGTDGPDTLLMERAGGRLVVKGGAEGVLCVGVRDAGIGLAIKMESGRGEGAHSVAIAALRQLDLLSPSEVEAMGELAAPPVRNHRGLHVGETQPVVILQRYG